MVLSSGAISGCPATYSTQIGGIVGKTSARALEELDLGEELRKGVAGRAACQAIGQADPVSVLLQDPDLQPVRIVHQFIHPSPNTYSSW